MISENLRFWRPTWWQVGIKIEAEIDVIFERLLFEKTLVFFRKTHFLDMQWVEIGNKNQSKIDVKNEAETERLGN